MTGIRKQCEMHSESDDGSALSRSKKLGVLKHIAPIVLAVASSISTACAQSDGGNEGAGGSESVAENSELGDRAVNLATNFKEWGFEGKYTSPFYLIVSLDGKPAFSTTVDKDDYGNDGKFYFFGRLNGACLIEVNAFQITPDGGPSDVEISIGSKKDGMYGNPRLEIPEVDCEKK
jgi:hypothetical protein